MKILEAICFFSFIAAWMAAECIPLCAVLFGVCFFSGFICSKEAKDEP